MRPDLSRYQYLKNFMAKSMLSLPENMEDSFCHSVCETMRLAEASGGQQPATIRLGTLCSGSELYMSVFKHLSRNIRKKYGIYINFAHQWSVEINPQKREWIQKSWRPKQLFGDVVALADNDGVGWDYQSKQEQNMLPVDWIIAGTS